MSAKKKPAKKARRLSAAERALAEKKVCVGNLEKTLSSLKSYRAARKGWERAIVRGKPVRLNESLGFWGFYEDYFPSSPSATSAWNLLAVTAPDACRDFHKAAMAAFDVAIKAIEAEAAKLAKGPC